MNSKIDINGASAPFLILKKYTTFLILCTVIISCQTKKQSPKTPHAHILNPHHEVTFDVGYPVRHKFNGCYFSRVDSTEYFYFADPATHKEIIFFTFKGVLKWRIPIKEMLKFGNDVNSISVVSPDTIIGLVNYSNKIFILNSLGNCWKKLDVNEQLTASTLGRYELTGSIFNHFLITEQDLIFCTDLQQNWDTLIYNKSQLETYRFLFSRLNNRYQFIKIENIYGDPKIQYGLKNFYPNKSGEYLYGEVGNYCYLNKRLFIFSFFSDTIYEVKIDDFTIMNKFHIQSNETKIGYEPIHITEDYFLKTPGEASQKAKTQGRINHIYFDNYTNRFIISVMHSVPYESPDSLIAENRTWSILIYDNNFRKLDEISFNRKTYFMDIIPCKEGILISNNWQTWNNYDKTKARYMLFKWSN